MAVAAALVLMLTAACGDDGDPAAAGREGVADAAPIDIPDDALDLTGQTEVTVTVDDNFFAQKVIVVDAGTTVTWTNEGQQPHNVKPAEENAFSSIDTGDLDPGASADRTFDDAGDFPYFCSLHGTATNGQTGRIIVAS